MVVEHLWNDITTRIRQQQRTNYLQIADGKSSGVVNAESDLYVTYRFTGSE